MGALGICAGPRSETGAFLLLAVGVAGIGAAIYGGYQVVRNIRHGDWPARLIGILSLGVGLFGVFLGWLFAFGAQDALKYYLGS